MSKIWANFKIKLTNAMKKTTKYLNNVIKLVKKIAFWSIIINLRCKNCKSKSQNWKFKNPKRTTKSNQSKNRTLSMKNKTKKFSFKTNF